MLTSRLQMLPNTSLCTLTTCNFNCREIGDGWVLTHISHPSPQHHPPTHSRLSSLTQMSYTNTLTSLHTYTPQPFIHNFLLPSIPPPHCVTTLTWSHHTFETRPKSSKLLSLETPSTVSTLPPYYDSPFLRWNSFSSFQTITNKLSIL